MSTQLNKNLMKNIGWLLLLLCSQTVIADSYVYVTNTTPETVSVNVNHHGTRTLTQGSQWAQEATQIAPYETKRVLRFNRYTGVKSGQTYNFDTVITGGGSSVTLKQSMTGTWSGSDINGSTTATFSVSTPIMQEKQRRLLLKLNTLVVMTTSTTLSIKIPCQNPLPAVLMSLKF